MILFRGTTRPGVQGVSKSFSYTPSLPVAIIWSALPGSAWGERKTAFLPTSTVHFAQLRTQHVLDLGANAATLGGILRALHYEEPGGITHAEVLKVFNYLHNRIVGKAPGGEFKYKQIDEDGEEVEEFSLRYSGVQLFKEEFDWTGGGVEIADRFVADTFIFADAPAVQRAARALGYEAIQYEDVFAGGTSAAPELLGLEVEELQGVDESMDIEDDVVPVHDTYRALTDTAIVPTGAVRTAELLRRLKRSDLMTP